MIMAIAAMAIDQRAFTASVNLAAGILAGQAASSPEDFREKSGDRLSRLQSSCRP